ncbi:MAG: hypothetical protein VX512_05955 [Pseudomonadota bacterium]|nr:hypothetical protein [Pseudomonadota bacterium]
MTTPPHRSLQAVSILLFSVVATQIIYFLLSEMGAEINRMIIWTVEAVAFLGISVFALVDRFAERRFSVALAAIAVGGMLNAIQVGMGLAMFPPLSEAGETMAPAFQSVLAGAFFLYFAGKFLFGAAAFQIGVHFFRDSGALKVLGALTALMGLVAMGINLFAMAQGMPLVFPAGLSGTISTLLLAVVVAIMAKRGEGLTDPRSLRS